MRLFILLSGLLLAAAGCQPSSTQETAAAPTFQQPKHHSESFVKLLDAHGGYEQWSKMKSLSYLKGDETTITDLQNRKIRLASPTQTIGFDGNQVWLSPDTLDAGRARFYHNLYFYFFAMPFVVGDPGVNYEEVPARMLKGQEYKGIKVSFGNGVGDAPDDNYILWYHPETNQMEWLMYTVTYRSGEPSDNYRLISYQGWTEFSGLLLPTKLQWYQFNEDTVGNPRGDGSVFSQIVLSESAPDAALFEMPENAIVAPR